MNLGGEGSITCCATTYCKSPNAYVHDFYSSPAEGRFGLAR